MLKKIINKIKKKYNAGFSLMETMIWVAIVGVFAGVVGIGGMQFINRAKVRAAKQELIVYSGALLEYYETEGEYPSEDEGLQKLISEGYIKLGPGQTKATDPWKVEYSYTLLDDGNAYSIKSFGSDKKEGGASGTKKDIVVSSQDATDTESEEYEED